MKLILIKNDPEMCFQYLWWFCIERENIIKSVGFPLQQKSGICDATNLPIFMMMLATETLSIWLESIRCKTLLTTNIWPHGSFYFITMPVYLPRATKQVLHSTFSKLQKDFVKKLKVHWEKHKKSWVKSWLFLFFLD